MTVFDWSIVIVLNGAIIVYGLFRARETKSSTDWFLAGRSLPWWVIGFSLYATAIDSSDLVADSGGTYSLGLSYFVTNWFGTVVGWMLAAHFIVLPMYRAGMYTNAEYLEARYGPAARVISAVVQVLYRTMVLGIIANTIYLTLSIVCGWDPIQSWAAVVAIALLATVYTAWGGLKSVAVTDALQSVVMVVASLILFLVVWSKVGGWSGLEAKLDDHRSGLAEQMLHVGHENVADEDVGELHAEVLQRKLSLGGEYDEERKRIVTTTPAWLVCVSFVIAGLSYSIVNHTQSMRLFGARSEWDLKMSVVVAGVLMLVMTFTNLMIGVMGRALYPDPALMIGLDESLQKADAIYPLLVRDLDIFAFKGLVVAGVLAASFSTFDSIGSTLSSLLVRDIYARLLVRNREDQHYLRVGRWLTPVIIFGSFLYVPFLQQGMLIFYLDLVAAFVVPLLTIYLMGIFTRVHRTSGVVGLLAGVVYGVLRLSTPLVLEQTGTLILPSVMMGSFAGSVFSMAITAGAMLIVSLVKGWEPRGELLHEEADGWLRSSQLEVRQIDQTHVVRRSDVWPVVLGIAVAATGGFLSFLLFW